MPRKLVKLPGKVPPGATPMLNARPLPKKKDWLQPRQYILRLASNSLASGIPSRRMPRRLVQLSTRVLTGATPTLSARPSPKRKD